MQVFPTKDRLFEADQDVLKHNYYALMDRAKWEHYKVNEEGRLVPLTVWENIQYFFSKSYHDQIQGHVKKAVEDVFRNMKYVSPGLVDEGDFLSQMENVLLKVRNFSNELFDRNVIKENEALFKPLRDRVIIQMRGGSAAEDKYKVKDHDGQFVDAYNPEVNDAERLFWETMGEAQIATWAFSSFQRNEGGTSGNYRIKDLNRNTVGIFKPVSESPHGLLNPYFWIRVRNVFQNYLGWDKDRVVNESRGHVREQFASVISNELGWTNPVTHQTLVPKARVVQMKSPDLQDKTKWQTGSVQTFIRDAKDGFTQFQVPEWTILRPVEKYLPATDSATAEKMDKREFQRIAILDYLLGNVDFNLGNVLFVNGAQQQNRAHSIDYWFSMPLTHPTYWLDTRNMHRWKALPYAQDHVPKCIQRELRNAWERIQEQAQLYFRDDATAIECLKARYNALTMLRDSLGNLPSDPGTWYERHLASRASASS